MKVILFDLDITLVDSSEGTTKGTQYALSYLRIDEPNLESLEKFIGPPLSHAFTDFYKLTGDDAALAVKKYREYYREKGIYQLKLYNGIAELLEALNVNNFKVLLATAKPELFATQILEDLGISKYFSYIAGALMDGRTDKTEVIRYAMESASISKDNGNVVMVGDREYDIIGANNVGIDSIGVLYGFGSREELQAENPYKIVETVTELKGELLIY